MKMSENDKIFRKVLKGNNSTTGESTKDKAKRDKLKAEGEKKASFERAMRNNRTKAFNKKLEREYNERWDNRGEVTDTGMFDK
jgi:hypothetical protein